MTKNQLKFLLILVAFALFQTTLFNFDLVLIAVLILAFLRSGKEILPNAFIAGICFDLFGRYPLASHSIVFLTLSLIILIIKEKLWAGKLRHAELNFLAGILILLLPEIFAIFLYDNLTGFLYQAQFSFTFEPMKLAVNLLASFVLYPVFSYLSLRWQEPEGIQLDFKEQV